MKITIDTNKILTPTELGQILIRFVEIYGFSSSLGDIVPTSIGDNVKEWERRTDTPRPLLVAAMGDGIYDHRPRWTHLRHKESGLDVISHHDGDPTIVFHKEGDDGFTIVNQGSSLQRWDYVDLNDPRNDPAYDPFKEVA